MPLAPTRFSITKFPPMRGPSICATIRAITSVLLPAGNGTMSLIGLLGQSAGIADCAPAPSAASASINNARKDLGITASLHRKGADKARHGIVSKLVPGL